MLLIFYEILIVKITSIFGECLQINMYIKSIVIFPFIQKIVLHCINNSSHNIFALTKQQFLELS